MCWDDGSFVRSPPFVRLRKVEKSFSSFAFVFSHFLFSPLQLPNDSRKGKSLRVKQKNEFIYFFITLHFSSSRAGKGGGGKKLSHLFTFKMNLAIKLSSLRSNLKMIRQIAPETFHCR